MSGTTRAVTRQDFHSDDVEIEAQGADLGGPRRLVPSPSLNHSLNMVNYRQLGRVVVAPLTLDALALSAAVFAGPAVALASAGSAHAAPAEPPPATSKSATETFTHTSAFDAVVDLGGEAAPSTPLGARVISSTAVPAAAVGRPPGHPAGRRLRDVPPPGRCRTVRRFCPA